MHNVCVGEMKTQIIRDWRNKFIIIMRENDYNGDEMIIRDQRNKFIIVTMRKRMTTMEMKCCIMVVLWEIEQMG